MMTKRPGNSAEGRPRHILALSGGKDSAALAVYMREAYPEIELEYVFTDSGCELPETYEFLDRIRALLSIDITVIKPKKDWERFWSLVKVKRAKEGTYTYLPSPKNRWCTEVLKLIPYERWLSSRYPNTTIHSYVGLRADEKRERKGLVLGRESFVPHFPFISDGLSYDDVEHLLTWSGLGFPSYYSWRKRSGCYFCFYQTKREWLGLYRHHPELFLKAQSYENTSTGKGEGYTWCDDMSLTELLERRDEIVGPEEERCEGTRLPKKLSEILGSAGILSR